MTADEEKDLWENAIIVFDTSALGDSYSLSFSAQQHFAEILKYLKDRIWIPAQVRLEFEIHHTKFLHSAIIECYSAEDKLNSLWQKYSDELSKFMSSLSGEETHPYFEEKALERFKEAVKRHNEIYVEIQSIIKDQFTDRRKEIQKAAIEDKIYEIYKLFEKGVEFSVTDLIEIAKEGEQRYKKSIPPGYMDSKEKHGIQKFGDLILWKEIIRYARLNSKDIILISDDVKEDWNVDQDDPAKGPRTELIDEFQKETGLRFWKYTHGQMIDKLEIYYAEDTSLLPIFGQLEKVHYQIQLKEIMRRRKLKMDNLTILKCSRCGHLFDVDKSDLCLAWEPNGTNERSMGVEHEYLAVDGIDCPCCRKQIELEFHVWEYPVGAFNYQSIDAVGADVIKEMDLSSEVNFFDEDLNYCEICGEYRYVNPENGICEECYERKWKEAMKED